VTKVEFYREKEFKKTEIGEIPQEWEVKRLGGEICEVNPNYEIQRGKIYKFVPMEAVSKDFYKVKFYTEREWKGTGVKFSYGDVLLARITPSVENGKTAIINFLNKDECGTGSTEFIVFKPIKADSFFVYYVLKWDKVRNQLISQMTGTTGRQRVPNSAPNRIKIFLPSFSEQKAIAKVLKDFDDLLEVIEEKIKTLQRIKKGLMEVYFTKGVFEHKEFKDTEIGRIPKEWGIYQIKDIFEIYAGGDAKKLNISSIKTKRHKYSVFSNAIENEGLYGYADTYQFPSNSITVTARGNLGYAIPRYEPYNAIVRLLVLVPKVNMDVYFVANFFNERIRVYDEQTSIKQLTKPKIAKYLIPFPPLEEQKAIAQRLRTIDDQIENLRNQKEVLQKIKKKFMDLLLTGKVRVREV